MKHDYNNQRNLNRGVNATDVELELVKENLSMIGSRGLGLRYWVIAPPINETGICFQFDSEEDAKAYMVGFGK